ncbi:MAG: translocation/assembly module TamB, partial [Bacteroidaceae bacterium]|nr:translocation/assembly module TamB [Bacteroidaceae bacterium]
KIENFTLRTPDKEEKIREFILNANIFEKQKKLTITSDFLNGYLTGIYSYNTLGNSFKLALQRIMPSLFDSNEITATNNDFTFDFIINNTSTLTNILNLPVTINKTSFIQGSCNDKHKLLSLSGNLGGVDYGKRKYKSINFSSEIDEKENTSNIILVRAPIPDESKSYNPDNDITINILSEIANDSLSANIKWKNLYIPTNKGDVKIDVALQRNSNNNLDVTALLHKGEITQCDTTWQLSPGKITSSNNVINIDNFSLQSNSQHIHINGNIGKSSEDKLNVALRHIDMEYVFDLIDFHPVELGGEVTGNIHASSILENINFNSKLQIKKLTFEHGLIGDLDFNGYWDEEQKAIILKGDAREGEESRTIIDGFVSPAQDSLNIGIDAQGTRIDFLNNLLSSIIEDASGRVTGKLHILGPLRGINMQGALAPLGQLKIKPTNTVYNLIGDTLRFTHNKIGFDGLHVKDNFSNSGRITGGVYHQNLKRFTVDLHIKADNLLAFHYPDFGEETFYGTAFVTGDAFLSVNPSGVNLRANVTTNRGSKFIYNASSPEGNINNEFVTFVDRRKRKNLITDMDIFGEEDTQKDINSKLHLDFMIDVTPDMQLRVYTNHASNDYIDIYGGGKVNAIYDEKAGFTMQGNLGLTRGTYKFTMQDIFPKEFDIRSGSSIDFNGDPFNANLNLKTVYNIPSVPLTDLSIDAERRKNVKVNCYMDISGTIFSPSLSFDLDIPDGNEEEKELLSSAISTPEQLNMQFIYLLGIGKFYTYDYNNQRAESQSSTAMESLISNTISGQLNNMLSQIIDDSNWNISGNFTTSEKGWNSMEVEGMLSGRLLDNRLLINGNLGYRDNPIANKNFIGDFEVQWLLNKSGNISLKAYNKTNDRYFSKTTLTTQGAGILLKRDFDGWKFWKK